MDSLLLLFFLLLITVYFIFKKILMNFKNKNKKFDFDYYRKPTTILDPYKKDMMIIPGPLIHIRTICFYRHKKQSLFLVQSLFGVGTVKGYDLLQWQIVLFDKESISTYRFYWEKRKRKLFLIGSYTRDEMQHIMVSKLDDNPISSALLKYLEKNESYWETDLLITENAIYFIGVSKKLPSDKIISQVKKEALVIKKIIKQ